MTGLFSKTDPDPFFLLLLRLLPPLKMTNAAAKKMRPAILKKKRLFVLRLFLVVYGITTLRKSLYCKYYENVSKTMRKI